MSSYRDSEFDFFLRSSLQDAVAGAEPSPAVWESIERRVLSSDDRPARTNPLRGLAQVLRPHLLQIQRHYFLVPGQYQRLSEDRTPLFVQTMVFPSAGCVPLAFM
jgi:hypothetical protein